jgi:uncharacterized protein YndB with AHSA1/START domain
MAGQATAATVKAAVTVDVPQQRAFEVFTRDYAAWVPEGQFMSPERPATVVIEPKAGGRWYERAKDGSETDWGRVLAYEPSARILFGWHLNGSWQFVPDPKQASEVELKFVADGPSKTRVELEHRGFDRHGSDGDGVRAAVASEMGWALTLQRFAEAAARS